MNSSYYYGLMQQIKSEQQTIINKKKEYEQFVGKLRNFKKTLEPLPNDFLRAERNYEDGGYVADGQTLSKGMLRKKGTELLDIIDEIGIIITKTEYKISDYTTQIQNLNSEYNSAYNKYERALSESGDTIR